MSQVRPALVVLTLLATTRLAGMPLPATAESLSPAEAMMADPSSAREDLVSPTDPLRDCYVSWFFGRPSALELAAAQGDIESVRLFLERYTVCSEFHKDRLLYFATIGLQPEVVDLLLAYRADPLGHVGAGTRMRTAKAGLLKCDALDRSSLEYGRILATLEAAEAAIGERSARAEEAVNAGEFDVVRAVLRAGLVKTDCIIAAALERDDAGLTAFALEHGAELPLNLPIGEWQKTNRQDLTACQRLVVDAVYCRNFQPMLIGGVMFLENWVNTLDKDMTPLMRACAECSALRVKALLEAGADAGVQNSEGKTAADYICAECDGPDAAAIRALLGVD
jgi:hypothetical protein